MNRSRIHVRLIPAMIVASVILLSYKLIGMSEALGLFQNPIKLTSALAQEQEDEKVNTGAEDNLKNDGAGDDKEGAEGKKEEDKAASKKEKKDDAENDPTLFTQSEIDLLQDLAERREKIEKTEQQIALKQGLLKAAETRIEKRVSELKQLELTIKGLIKDHDDQQEKKMNSLVKIYEAMKPKDAARIFEQLDIDTILLVAERMKERRLAPVMAQMNPEKAKDITIKLSKLRELPLPGTVIVQ